MVEKFAKRRAARIAMHCHKEFPLWKTAYNLVALDAFAVSGVVVCGASLGLWGAAGFLATLMLGMTLSVTTVCRRCSYYGQRCGLGLGKLATLVGREANSEEFCRTPSQYLAMVVLGAAPVVGLVGAIVMLEAGTWVWPSLHVLSVLALLVPHPIWMCRYCMQREQGACPVGRALVRGRAR